MPSFTGQKNYKSLSDDDEGIYYYNYPINFQALNSQKSTFRWIVWFKIKKFLF